MLTLKHIQNVQNMYAQQSNRLIFITDEIGNIITRVSNDEVIKGFNVNEDKHLLVQIHKHLNNIKILKNTSSECLLRDNIKAAVQPITILENIKHYVWILSNKPTSETYYSELAIVEEFTSVYKGMMESCVALEDDRVASTSLNQIGSSIGCIGNTTPYLDAIVEFDKNIQFLGYARIKINETFQIEDHTNLSEIDLLNKRLAIKYTFFEELYKKEDEIFIWEDIKRDPRNVFYSEFGIVLQDLVCYPIRIDQELKGFLFIAVKEDKKLKSKTLSFLKYVVKLLKYENKINSLNSNMDKQLMRIATTMDISKAIFGLSDLSEGIRMFSDLTNHLLQGEATFFIYKNEIKYFKNYSKIMTDESSRLFLEELYTKYVSMSTEDVYSPDITFEINEWGVVYYSPLFVEGKVKGIISVILNKKYNLKETEVFILTLSRICEFTIRHLEQKDKLLNYRQNDQQFVESISERHAKQLKQKITNREYEVLQCAIKGRSNKEIAEELHISIHTVKNHLTNIFQKLGVTDRSELLAFIYQQSI